MQKNNKKSGVATLSTTLIISSIILLVAVYGTIISVIFMNTALNERLGSEATVIARSGLQDAIIRIVRYKNCPTSGETSNCPSSYSLVVGGGTATITIVDNGGGSMTVSSTGSTLSRKKKLVANLGVDTTTGEVRVYSLKEGQI